MLNTEATPPEYNIFEVNSSGKGNILATITDAPAAYIHSMFSTENYVILIVWQSDFGKKTSKPYYNVLDNLKDWDPERKTLFCGIKIALLLLILANISPDVVDKVKGGVVAKYTSETFFAFHEVNCTYYMQPQRHWLTKNRSTRLKIAMDLSSLIFLL